MTRRRITIFMQLICHELNEMAETTIKWLRQPLFSVRVNDVCWPSFSMRGSNKRLQTKLRGASHHGMVEAPQAHFRL
jgi:hypothetical protein